MSLSNRLSIRERENIGGNANNLNNLLNEYQPSYCQWPTEQKEFKTQPKYEMKEPQKKWDATETTTNKRSKMHTTSLKAQVNKVYQEHRKNEEKKRLLMKLMLRETQRIQAEKEAEERKKMEESGVVCTVPRARIGKIRFGIMSPEAIRRCAVAHIDTPAIYYKRIPTEGGVNDLMMGTTSRSLPCKMQMCQADPLNCPGHWGFLELAKPVVNMEYAKFVLKILRAVCHCCSKMIIRETHPKYKHIMGLTPIARLQMFAKIAKDYGRCGTEDEDNADEKKIVEASKNFVVPSLPSKAKKRSTRTTKRSESKSSKRRRSKSRSRSRSSNRSNRSRSRSQSNDRSGQRQGQLQVQGQVHVQGQVKKSKSKKKQTNKGVKAVSKDNLAPSPNSKYVGADAGTDTDTDTDTSDAQASQVNREQKPKVKDQCAAGGCVYQPDWKRKGLDFIASFDHLEEKDRPPPSIKFDTEKILRIFHNISDEDIVKLGFDPQMSRPEWMVMPLLPIPPPNIRQAREHNEGDGTRGQDDLTLKLKKIVGLNEKLKALLEDEERGKYLASRGKSESHNNVQQLQPKRPGRNYVDDEQRKEALLYELRYEIATYMNNEIPGITPSTERNGQPTQGIRQKIPAKKGRIRGNCLGKRTNRCGRTVISPECFYPIEYCGVPDKMAAILTRDVRVQDYNVHDLTARVRLGPDAVGGANAIILPDKTRIDLKFVDRQRLVLQKGWIVERHMLDGDIVLLNRQPTLHRPSIMACKVKIMQNQCTIGLAMPATGAYNADFDGDEMTVHVVGDEMVQGEVAKLMGVECCVLSPRHGEPIIIPVQNAPNSLYKMTQRKTVLSYSEAIQMLYTACCWDGAAPACTDKEEMLVAQAQKDCALCRAATQREAEKEVERQNERQKVDHQIEDDPNNTQTINSAPSSASASSVFSNIDSSVSGSVSGSVSSSVSGSGSGAKAPDKFATFSADVRLKELERLKGLAKQKYFERRAPVHEKMVSGRAVLSALLPQSLEIRDEGFCVHNGHVVRGQDEGDGLNRDAFRRIVKVLAKDHGPRVVTNFISGVQVLLNAFILHKGCSLDLQECMNPCPEKTTPLVQNALDWVDKVDVTGSPRKEAVVLEVLERILTQVGGHIYKTLENKLDQCPSYQHCLLQIVKSGAKGNKLNIIQILGLLGQQFLMSKRVDAILPQYLPDEIRRGAGVRGFVDTSYSGGLSPANYFRHAMAGRENIVDIAVKVSATGYQERKLTTCLGDLQVQQDGSVRSFEGCMYQMLYGDDGNDATFVEFVPLRTLMLDNTALRNLYHCSPDLPSNLPPDLPPVSDASNAPNASNVPNILNAPNLSNASNISSPSDVCNSTNGAASSTASVLANPNGAVQDAIKNGTDLFAEELQQNYDGSNERQSFAKHNSNQDWDWDWAEEEYQIIKQERDILRTLQLRDGTELQTNLQCTVPFSRVFDRSETLHKQKIREGSVERAMNPRYIYEAVRAFAESLVDKNLISPLMMNQPVCHFGALLHDWFSAKRLSSCGWSRSTLDFAFDMVERHCVQGAIVAGEQVGTLAAQSIGEPATQMTLNTFHYAGQKAASALGVPRIKEITSGTEENKMLTPTMLVPIRPDYLAQCATEDEKKYLIESIAQSLPQVLFKDLVASVRVESDHKLRAAAVASQSLLTNTSSSSTPASLATLPNLLTSSVFDQSPFSSTLMEEAVTKKAKHQGLRTLDKLTQALNAIESPFTEGVDGSTFCDLQDRKGLASYTIRFDLKKSKCVKYMLGPKKIAEIVQEKIFKNEVHEWECSPAANDEWYVRLRVNQDTKDFANEVRKYSRSGLGAIDMGFFYENFATRLLRDVPVRGCARIKAAYVKSVNTTQVDPHTGAILQSKELMIETRGANLREIMQYPEVDTTRVVTNDIQSMAAVLGIHAGQAWIDEQMQEVIRYNGSAVNTRHTKLMSKCMTATGVILPMNRFGVLKDKKSVLQRISFEEAAEKLFQASAYSMTDPLLGVTENTMLGNVSSMGSTVSDIRLDNDPRVNSRFTSSTNQGLNPRTTSCTTTESLVHLRDKDQDTDLNKEKEKIKEEQKAIQKATQKEEEEKDEDEDEENDIESIIAHNQRTFASRRICTDVGMDRFSDATSDTQNGSQILDKDINQVPADESLRSFCYMKPPPAKTPIVLSDWSDLLYVGEESESGGGELGVKKLMPRNSVGYSDYHGGILSTEGVDDPNMADKCSFRPASPTPDNHSLRRGNTISAFFSLASAGYCDREHQQNSLPSLAAPSSKNKQCTNFGRCGNYCLAKYCARCYALLQPRYV